jgi:hypothetical protein
MKILSALILHLTSGVITLLVVVSLVGGCAGNDGNVGNDGDAGNAGSAYGHIDGTDGAKDTPFLFNSLASHRFLGAKNYVVLNAEQLYFIEKKTGIVRPLILNPLERLLEEEREGLVTFNNSKIAHVSGNRAYILENDYLSMRPDVAAFDLFYVNLENFDQISLLSVGKRVHEYRFLPLPSLMPDQDRLRGYFDDASENSTGENAALVARYFVLSGALYTIENNTLCRRGLSGGPVSVLADDLYPRTQVSCDGERIYYVNNRMELMEYRLKNDHSRKVTDAKVNGLYVSHDAIYYKDLANGQALYRYDKQAGTVKKISDSDLPAMQAVASWIYYLDADGKLCRMPSKGGESEMVIDDEIGDYYVDEFDQSIYYETYEQIDGEFERVYYRVDGIDGAGGAGGKDGNAVILKLD